MDINIPIENLRLVRGEIVETTDEGIVFLCPKEGLRIEGSGEPGSPFGGIDWTSKKALNLQLEVLAEDTARFSFRFRRYDNDTEWEDMDVSFCLLPHVVTNIPIDLSLLDSHTIFPRRPKGALKFWVGGKPLDRGAVDRVVFESAPCCYERKILLRAFYLSDELLPEEAPEVKLIDELGQWIPREWPGKMKSRAECNSYLQDLFLKAREIPESDTFGGWSEKQFKSTGWFRTEYDGKRWWLVDPKGNAFFTAGIDCVCPGIDTCKDGMESFISCMPEYTDKNYYYNNKTIDFGISNLIAAFGKENWWDNWAKITKYFLHKWGFNTIGNWSEDRFIRYAKIPYVIPLDVKSKVGFPKTKVTIFRDFPDVFADEYERNADIYAEALREFADDPYMLGYFMCNEPAWCFVWNLNISEEMLARPERYESKKAFIKWLGEKYGSIDAFNKAWNLKLESFDDLYKPIYRAGRLSESALEDLKAFSKIMVTRYVELPAKKCREIDDHHLNLGMRYAFISDPVLLAGSENFDVFTINCYDESPYVKIDNIGKQLQMPVMIGEFHFGALDRGLPSTGIRGVSSQEERGKAYRYYLEQGMQSPYFVGAHYFIYNDQSCLGRDDGENGQIGLIDVCMREYTEMTDEVTACNKDMYEILSGQKESKAVRAQSIPTHY